MSSSSMAKVCFNPECKSSVSGAWRKGWRLRNHDFAYLCDFCGSMYEEGRFCETFHKYASGWRSCETCGKRVHCGCIVSTHAFIVLDAGGIECTVCAKKNAIQTPNPMWPSRPLTGWLMGLPTRNWNQSARSRPPKPWQHAVNSFKKTCAYSNLDSLSTAFERLICSERLASFPSERNQNQNFSFSNGILNHNGSDMLEFGKAVFNRVEEPHSCLMNPVDQSVLKTLNPSLASQGDDQQIGVCGVHAQQISHQDVVGKQCRANSRNGGDSCRQTQICNGKPVDLRVQKKLLPRYWPKISDEELQQISSGSKSVITPLFEKMLSASDAGRNGRLVLPKKCAETCFPRISQPEGLPLKVQDVKGKEWTFQFRFWPNNNSRKYVLEGITNCIQSFQLQVGDVVTFSRLEPEGKLIMGFRKATAGPQSEQGTQAVVNGKEVPTGDVIDLKPKLNEDPTNCRLKDYPISKCLSSMDQSNTVDLASVSSETDKSGCVVKEAIRASSCIPSKRKNGMLSLKRNQRTRVNDVDLLELNVTLVEAQGLFRSPANHAPRAVIIEEFEFEEYEDAPVIGRPTVITKDSVGEDIKWAQCDECLKWRKLPSDALLPARWMCSKNTWDPDRSSCDAAQELTVEQLKDLLSTNNPDASKKLQEAELDDAHHDPQSSNHPLPGFSIKRDSEAGLRSVNATTTKHPRHTPGCSCVVCVQPPSRKGGPKHPKSCACNICLMIKRRIQTTMLRRDRNKSEKEAPEKSDPLESSCAGFVDADDEKDIFTPMKGQIDLNIQPEREG